MVKSCYFGQTENSGGNMPGFIEYEGKKGFLLKKEHISKIENAIKHRLEMWGISQDIIYKVYRCDSYYY